MLSGGFMYSVRSNLNKCNKVILKKNLHSFICSAEHTWNKSRPGLFVRKTLDLTRPCARVSLRRHGTVLARKIFYIYY